MENKTLSNTSKGKIYLTVFAIASLLVMAFNVNTNSMNVNAIDFGLISKDTNIGSIDNDSLFNCFGAAITCDNDNTVNNDIAINNGTNENVGGDTPLPQIPLNVCVNCLENLESIERTEIKIALGLGDDDAEIEICEAIDALGTVENLVLILNEAGLTIGEIADLLDCFGITITPGEVNAILLR